MNAFPVSYLGLYIEDEVVRVEWGFTLAFPIAIHIFAEVWNRGIPAVVIHCLSCRISKGHYTYPCRFQ